MKTVLIAVPTNKYIEPETFKSIYDLTCPAGFKTHFAYAYGYQIDEIRNLIADWSKDYDYLLCVDSDIIMPNNTLIKMLNADKDIISGLYRKKTKNIQYEVSYYDESKQIQKVDWVGFGCILIKSDVIKTIDYPYFYYQSALSDNERITEDVYFCNKARSYGYDVWIDPSIRLTHKGINYYE